MILDKTFITLFSLLSVTLVVGAQTQSAHVDSTTQAPNTAQDCCQPIAGITTIRFDFKEKKFVGGDELLLQKLKLGDLYQIKICNINTNLYKISIGKRDTIINTALTVPTFSGFGISDLTSLISGLTTATSIVAPTDANHLDMTDLSAQVMAKDLFKGLGNYTVGIKKYARDKGKQPPSDEDIVKGIMLSYETVLKDNFQKLNALKQQTDDLMNKYNRFIIQSQVEFKSASSQTFFNLTGMSIEEVYTKFNNIRSNISAISAAVEIANAKYTTESTPYNALIQKTDGLKKNDDKLKSTYQQFTTTISKANDVVSADNILKFISSLNIVLNNIKREYTSFPLQFSKDQNTLIISVQPRKDDSGLEPYSTSFTFPLKQHSFWAVSTGAYFSTLYNKSYSTLRTVGASNDTTYTLKSEQPKPFEFGINAMVRYGWEMGKSEYNNYWQVGCGPGVTVSDKVRARLMLGTGFAHGKKHKLVIDAGVISGYTDQLSVLYKENSSYSLNPGTAVISKLNFGFYSSVSYLFY